MERRFKKEDYVVCEYDGELLSAKVLEILPEGYRIEMYVDTLDDDIRLMQEVVVSEKQLRPVQIAVVNSKSVPLDEAATIRF